MTRKSTIRMAVGIALLAAAAGTAAVTVPASAAERVECAAVAPNFDCVAIGVATSGTFTYGLSNQGCDAAYYTVRINNIEDAIGVKYRGENITFTRQNVTPNVPVAVEVTGEGCGDGSGGQVVGYLEL